MSNNETISADRARHMLKEIAEMSQEASMTGMLDGGAGRAILRYNMLIAQCEAGGLLPKGLFSQLPESASYAELGVEARLARAGIDTGNGRSNGGDEGRRTRGVDFGAIVRIAPFVGSEELGALVRDQIRSGMNVGMDILTSLAPFLDQQTINSIVREHLNIPSAPEKPNEPVAPQPAAAPDPAPTAPSTFLPEVAPNEELQRLAARLSDPNLSPEERSQIAVRLSEVALQQGQIAREG